MWQRKQTIFLVGVVCSMVLSIFFPIWKFVSNESEISLFPIHYSVMLTEGSNKDTIYFPYCIVAILAAASSTVAVIEIGKFRERLLQLKLGALNSLFITACIGSALYFVNDLSDTHNMDGRYGLAIVLPLVAMLSNMLANRFIRKDEQVVRDSDSVR